MSTRRASGVAAAATAALVLAAFTADAPRADAAAKSKPNPTPCKGMGKANAKHKCCKPGTVAAHKGKRTVCLSARTSGAYKLVYTHRSSWDITQPYSQPAFQGTGTTREIEHWQLTATIPLRGNPAKRLTGSGPITYKHSDYSRQTISHEKAGQAAVWCDSTSTSTLVGTIRSSAKATVTLKSPRAVSLSFDPGQPRESYHDTTVIGAGPCGDADYRTSGGLWRNLFTLVPAYGKLAFMPATPPVVIASGWKPGRGKVVATRTVKLNRFPIDTARHGSGSWHDTYQISRG